MCELDAPQFSKFALLRGTPSKFMMLLIQKLCSRARKLEMFDDVSS